MPEDLDRPAPTPSDRWTWVYLVLSALALLYVLFAPFSVFVSPEVVQPWYAGVAGITWVGVALFWWRPRFNCLEMFIPMVATVWVVSFTAARPDVIGPWIPAAQGLAVAAILLGIRVRGPRRAGRDVIPPRRS